MKCPKCGRDLPYGSKYCLFCNISVENDEIPEITASEPTRVMPSVGEKKKKPKLKSEKKKKLILFYSSIGAIVLLIAVFIFIIFRSCAAPEEKLPAFDFSSVSQTSAASQHESAVSLPVYSTVDKNTSSGAASSASAISSSAVSSTESKPQIMPANQYLSFTVADLKKNFGEIASREDNEGEGSILSFNGCKYKFIVNAQTPADGDRVSSIIVTKGGEIVSGATVGQTYTEIWDAFGKINPNVKFQFAYDEAEEIAVATTNYNNATYYIYFEKEDKNIPSLSALIKQN